MLRYIRTILVVCAIVALTGCGPKAVRTEQVGEPVVSKEVIPCETFGLCYSCSFGECGLGLSSSCPGTQAAMVSKTRLKTTYDDDTTTERVETRVISIIEPCSRWGSSPPRTEPRAEMRDSVRGFVLYEISTYKPACLSLGSSTSKWLILVIDLWFLSVFPYFLK